MTPTASSTSIASEGCRRRPPSSAPSSPPRSWRATLLTAALASLALAGCNGSHRDTTEHTGELATDAASTSTEATTPSDTPQPDAEPACLPQCSGLAEVQRCDDRDQLSAPEPCADDHACVGGRCAPLNIPEAGALAFKATPERVQRLSPEGWINAWAMAGPDDDDKLPIEAAARRQPVAAEGLSWVRRCAPQPFVQTMERLGKRRVVNKPLDTHGEAVILTTWLVSGRAQPAWLKFGTMGAATVWFNGREVAQTRSVSNARPFPDEQVAQVALEAGVNTLTFRVARTSRWPTGIQARLRDANHRPLRDLGVITPTSEACTLDRLTAIEQTLSPTAQGIEARATLSLPGVVPLEETLTWQARLLRPPKGRRARRANQGQTFGQGSAPVAAMLSDAPLVLKANAKVSKPGTWTVKLDLNEVPSREASFERRADEARRVEALSRGRDAALSAARDADIAQDSQDTFEWLVSDLARRVLRKLRDPRQLERRLKQAEALAAGFQKGEDPLPAMTGVIMRAYRSEIDGQLQPYAVWLPRSYKRLPNEQFPLVVVAHGLNGKPEDALRTALGNEWRDRRAVLAAPWGFKHSGQRLLGEHDTLRVIEEMKDAYRLHPRRVSITGASLGGTVAFTVPLHHPGHFGAAVPLCGYPNLETYSQIEGVESRQPWEETLILKKSVRHYTENALHLKMRIVHGGKDDPARSAVIAKRMRRLGYWHIFDIQDDMGHNVWDYAYDKGDMILWLKNRWIADKPRRDRLKTADYRYNASHWLRLWRFEDTSRYAELDARWDKRGAALKVRADNVAAFEIDLNNTPREGDATLSVNEGAPITLPADAPRAILTKAGDAWQLTERAPDSTGQKRPGVAGPLDDVQTHPQIVVYGTLDPDQVETHRLVAEHFSGQDRRSDVRIPIRADRDLTEDEIKAHSLILIGNPRTNSITARFIDHLPVKFGDDHLTLGARRHEGEDVGVSLIHPHPLNPDEYLVLHAGVGVAGTLAARHLPELVPDFVVYDRRFAVQRWNTLMDRRQPLDGGFFTDAWALPTSP